MFNEASFRQHASEVLAIADRLAQLRRLFKTDGGHLTAAGRALALEGARAGMTTGEIAGLLEVNPAVVRYHLRANARPVAPARRPAPSRRQIDESEPVLFAA